jgi:hypothetical protein
MRPEIGEKQQQQPTEKPHRFSPDKLELVSDRRCGRGDYNPFAKTASQRRSKKDDVCMKKTPIYISAQNVRIRAAKSSYSAQGVRRPTGAPKSPGPETANDFRI